jgi:uncharacterized protein
LWDIKFNLLEINEMIFKNCMSAQKQTIVIAGGSGLVGSALLNHIDLERYDVYVMSRSNHSSSDRVKYISWDTDAQTCNLNFEPDHIINLAGAGIADQRWTEDRKDTLLRSRTSSAETIAAVLARNHYNPKTYLSASAIGYYGDRADEILTEESKVGLGFMAECCQQWETAGLSAGKYCARTIILRIGIVLSTQDGALPKMMMTKSVGLYNYFGDGSQYYAWIHIDDLCRMIMYTIENTNVDSIINAVSPEPISNKSFMNTIITTLQSNGILIAAPRFALRLAMGEMADVVLNSNRVISTKWQALGFKFLYPTLPDAIRDLYISRRD